jgi:DNA repair photolyase
MAGEQLFEVARRTFDTPHFRGIEFIETEAKTIINHVPGNRLPFSWTINAYRGCSHACTYCLVGDTPILMTDGRTKPLSQLSVGDSVYGTRREGFYRRYVRSEVLAHWPTTKPAYRVRLEDGTELTASADHRFLTDRGWKHVAPAAPGQGQRPYLTTNNKLIGIGRFAKQPKHDREYQRGYLTGMIRGDGHVGHYSYDRAGRTHGDVHRFRLALVDLEALRRTREYLATSAVETKTFVFSEANARHRRAEAIRTSARSSVEEVERIIEWPERASLSWCRGFLAGIFDAEGSFSCLTLRISNTDPRIIAEIESCLRRLRFMYVVERTKTQNPVTVVRLIGGLPEKLRFFHTVDPAITRKRTFEGTALKRDRPLRVRSIEELGLSLPMFDITTSTGDFIANGVVSHNCFARATHTFLDMDAGKDFETKIVVKVNAPQLLRKELRAKRWKGESIAMGTNTDPYQRAEGRYRLTRGLIETLVEFGNPFSILTKGTLILRDLDLLQEAAAISEITTAFSIPTLDEDAWRKSEPGTPHPRKRVEAVKKLNDAGIPCGVLIAPVQPGITGSDKQLREVIEACLGAGATHVVPILLHLRPKVREVYMEWLQDTYPELVTTYERMYQRTYASKDAQAALSKRVAAITKNLPAPSRPRPRVRRKPAPKKPETEQLSLI